MPNPDDFSYDVELIGDDGVDDVQDDEMLVEGVKHTLLSYVTVNSRISLIEIIPLRRDKALVNKVRMRLFLRKHLVPHVDKYIVKVKRNVSKHATILMYRLHHKRNTASTLSNGTLCAPGRNPFARQRPWARSR